ncbi:ribosomal protein S12 methylthiotransferase accessory factor [Lentzea albidocapillata subsp. violacea]|uniref:Ribosomal protein S12 methylthiotransferase accessory factor n=1 Tax=Lentzea albidocapillata subsp. violacea TaxID=128104 RepID=A0A1G9XTV4_9PSEU|nr:YcaO-like family protein [Lentzea albidocapillata]SDN00170.1 ribosomal protein S12 methylthiotransferase accessory factor [Lentzea albidocapillata subsp. violacea]
MTSDQLVLSQFEVRRLRDGESLVRSRLGDVFEVKLDADRLAAAFALCDGSRTLDEVVVLADMPPAFQTVVDVLLAREDHDLAGKAGSVQRGAALVVAGAADVLALWRETRGIRPHHLSEPVWLDDQDLTALSPALSPGSVLVTVHRWRDGELLRQVGNQAAAAGATWVPVVFDGAAVWLGPVVRPGATPVYDDVLDRRVAAAIDPDVTQALQTRPLTADVPVDETDVLWVGAVLAQLLAQLADGRPCALFGNEVEADPATLRLRPHPVLPMPYRADAPYRNDVVSGPDLLVDDVTGLVAQLGDVPLLPEMPSSLRTVVARVSDVRRLGVPWGVNTIAGCSVLNGDRATVEACAVGESVERYSGNWVQLDRTVVGTYEEMTRRRERVLDPESVVLYSDEQYSTPGFPFVPFRHDTEVRWVLGWSVTREDAVWVPAGMAWGNYNLGPSKKEPPLHPTLYAGLAAGVNLDEAIRGGLEEVLERHAAMSWWSHQATLPRLRPSPQLAAYWKTAAAGSDLTGWLLHVENRFGLPVIAGVVNDPKRELTTVGFALREDAELCALKAWGEALSNLLWAVDLLQEHGAYWSELRDMHDVRRRGGKLGYLKPWRADRRYLDSFRKDFRDVGDLESQLQLTCDTRARERVTEVLRGGRELDLDGLPTPADRSLETYRRIVEAQDFEILAVDLTTPDVRYADLSVVRVLVPGLVNNFAAAFPLWGKGVLAGEAALLGWRDTPAAEEELNVFPMPHA